jgi:hypothetical protein
MARGPESQFSSDPFPPNIEFGFSIAQNHKRRKRQPLLTIFVKPNMEASQERDSQFFKAHADESRLKMLWLPRDIIESQALRMMIK